MPEMQESLEYYEVRWELQSEREDFPRSGTMVVRANSSFTAKYLVESYIPGSKATLVVPSPLERGEG